MGCVMAVATLIKFFPDIIRVRHPMAILAAGYHAMPAMVTAGALHLSVPGPCCGNGCINLVMARSAIFGGDIFTVCYNKGHMRPVAARAALLSHGVRVGQMTILARLNLSMIIMTGRALEDRMDTRVSFQLFNLLGMTGETGTGNIFSQLNSQRVMGIGMTVHTALQGIMVRTLMAATAGGNNFHINRRMSLVTFQAQFPMSSTLALQGDDHLIMAFAAVIHSDSCPNRSLLFLNCSCIMLPEKGENSKPYQA